MNATTNIIKTSIKNELKTTKPSKRKIVEKNLTQYDTLVKKSKYDISAIKFNVSSSTDDTKSYEVKIYNMEEGIKLECDCGDQWGIKNKRNNCKHLGAVVSSILKQYICNQNKKSDELDEIINKLDNIIL